MWGVDNGRDLIGDDLPPEEVNIIKQGEHYGWPYCYGRGVANPEYPDKKEFCQSTESPIVEMQAHSAPLGMRFYEAGNWPDRYDGSLFVGFHGSWNRSVPTGYKIVRIDKDLKVHDFITGWLNEANDKAWGRPVDILFVGDDMYVTDDAGGRIFKVSLK
jgi:glucose/arabinose dehydrogenase